MATIHFSPLTGKRFTDSLFIFFGARASVLELDHSHIRLAISESRANVTRVPHLAHPAAGPTPLRREVEPRDLWMQWQTSRTSGLAPARTLLAPTERSLKTIIAQRNERDASTDSLPWSAGKGHVSRMPWTQCPRQTDTLWPALAHLHAHGWLDVNYLEGPCSNGPYPQYGWDFTEEIPEEIPERPRKRSQSVSWNFPREYGWDAPNPIIQGI